jgi:hypothetical protein
MRTCIHTTSPSAAEISIYCIFNLLNVTAVIVSFVRLGAELIISSVTEGGEKRTVFASDLKYQQM